MLLFPGVVHKGVRAAPSCHTPDVTWGATGSIDVTLISRTAYSKIIVINIYIRIAQTPEIIRSLLKTNFFSLAVQFEWFERGFLLLHISIYFILLFHQGCCFYFKIQTSFENGGKFMLDPNRPCWNTLCQIRWNMIFGTKWFCSTGTWIIQHW